MSKAERIQRTNRVVNRRVKFIMQTSILNEKNNVLDNPTASYGQYIKYHTDPKHGGGGWGDPMMELERAFAIQQKWIEDIVHRARDHYPFSNCSCGHCQAERWYQRLERRRKRQMEKEKIRMEFETGDWEEDDYDTDDF